MTTEDDRRYPDGLDDNASADDWEGYNWDDPSANKRAEDACYRNRKNQHGADATAEWQLKIRESTKNAGVVGGPREQAS